MIKLTLIAAHDRNGVIGFNNQLPWSIPEDLAFFKNATLGKSVIMGRKTHESIGFALPGRENIVLTGKASRQFKGCITSTSLEAAIAYCEHRGEDEVFIIGGAQLYAEALKYAHKLMLTEIDQEFVGDAHFPRFDRNRFIEVLREHRTCATRPDITFAFVTYEREDVLRQRQETNRLLQMVRDADSHPHDSSMKQNIQEMILEACKRPILPDGYPSFVRNLNAVKEKHLMSKKIRHPQHILVIDKEFTDELPGMGLRHGVTQWTSRDQYNYWLEHSVSHLMTGQREKMEFDPRFRQILPYIPVIFSDTPENIDWANSPIFLYQRTKLVGEQRLGKKFSIGTGGHVDHADVQHHKSIVSFDATLTVNMTREVMHEELEFKDGDKVLNMADIPASWEEAPEIKFVPFGLIRDGGDNVGRVHLGVVTVIVVPMRYEVRCKEEELITCTPMSATMLKDAGLEYEGWTQILIDAFLGLPCSVKPSEPRRIYEEILSGLTYVESVKGDTWKDLAIELGFTVSTLYRHNLANYESNEIDPGTRVVLPYGSRLSKLETPTSLIDALNNDTQGARAKAVDIINNSAQAEQVKAEVTQSVLSGILNMGPDYGDCGLRFLVTQDMADRLVVLDSGINDLITAGVVVIVEKDHLPMVDSMTVDTETAERVKNGEIVWQYGAPYDLSLNAGVPGEVIEHSKAYPEMPNPTEQDLADPIFEAIWQTIKGWDVNVPTHYAGYCGANGSHVKMILDNVVGILPGTAVHNGALNVTGDLKLSSETLEDVEVGFRRAVELGEANGTARHVLENGDSFNSICEKYSISKDDFERWNGFKHGHTWPTHTGYVFVADPAITNAEEPTL